MAQGVGRQVGGAAVPDVPGLAVAVHLAAHQLLLRDGRDAGRHQLAAQDLGVVRVPVRLFGRRQGLEQLLGDDVLDARQPRRAAVAVEQRALREVLVDLAAVVMRLHLVLGALLHRVEAHQVHVHRTQRRLALQQLRAGFEHARLGRLVVARRHAVLLCLHHTGADGDGDECRGRSACCERTGVGARRTALRRWSCVIDVHASRPSCRMRQVAFREARRADAQNCCMTPPRVWLFDLDNTLHNASVASLSPASTPAMSAYIERELDLTPDEAACAARPVPATLRRHAARPGAPSRRQGGALPARHARAARARVAGPWPPARFRGARPPARAQGHPDQRAARLCRARAEGARRRAPLRRGAVHRGHGDVRRTCGPSPTRACCAGSRHG